MNREAVSCRKTQQTRIRMTVIANVTSRQTTPKKSYSSTPRFLKRYCILSTPAARENVRNYGQL